MVMTKFWAARLNLLLWQSHHHKSTPILPCRPFGVCACIAINASVTVINSRQSGNDAPCATDQEGVARLCRLSDVKYHRTRPTYMFAVCVPTKVIRPHFPEPIIEALLRIA